MSFLSGYKPSKTAVNGCRVKLKPLCYTLLIVSNPLGSTIINLNVHGTHFTYS